MLFYTLTHTHIPLHTHAQTSHITYITYTHTLTHTLIEKMIRGRKTLSLVMQVCVWWKSDPSAFILSSFYFHASPRWRKPLSFFTFIFIFLLSFFLFLLSFFLSFFLFSHFCLLSLCLSISFFFLSVFLFLLSFSLSFYFYFLSFCLSISTFFFLFFCLSISTFFLLVFLFLLSFSLSFYFYFLSLCLSFYIVFLLLLTNYLFAILCFYNCSKECTSRMKNCNFWMKMVWFSKNGFTKNKYYFHNSWLII